MRNRWERYKGTLLHGGGITDWDTAWHPIATKVAPVRKFRFRVNLTYDRRKYSTYRGYWNDLNVSKLPTFITRNWVCLKEKKYKRKAYVVLEVQTTLGLRTSLPGLVRVRS